TPDHFLEVYEPSAPEFKTGDVVRRTTWSQRQRIGVISDIREDGSLSVDYGDTTSTGVKPYRGAATGPAGVSPTGVSVPVIDERVWYVRTWCGGFERYSDRDRAAEDLVEGEVLVTFRDGRLVTPVVIDGVEYLLPLPSRAGGQADEDRRGKSHEEKAHPPTWRAYEKESRMTTIEELQTNLTLMEAE